MSKVTFRRVRSVPAPECLGLPVGSSLHVGIMTGAQRDEYMTRVALLRESVATACGLDDPAKLDKEMLAKHFTAHPEMSGQFNAIQFTMVAWCLLHADGESKGQPLYATGEEVGAAFDFEQLEAVTAICEEVNALTKPGQQVVQADFFGPPKDAGGTGLPA